MSHHRQNGDVDGDLASQNSDRDSRWGKIAISKYPKGARAIALSPINMTSLRPRSSARRDRVGRATINPMAKEAITMPICWPLPPRVSINSGNVGSNPANPAQKHNPATNKMARFDLTDGLKVEKTVTVRLLP
jgi:hypothetical protein